MTSCNKKKTKNNVIEIENQNVITAWYSNYKVCLSFAISNSRVFRFSSSDCCSKSRRRFSRAYLLSDSCCSQANRLSDSCWWNSSFCFQCSKLASNFFSSINRDSFCKSTTTSPMDFGFLFKFLLFGVSDGADPRC